MTGGERQRVWHCHSAVASSPLVSRMRREPPDLIEDDADGDLLGIGRLRLEVAGRARRRFARGDRVATAGAERSAATGPAIAVSNMSW